MRKIFVVLFIFAAITVQAQAPAYQRGDTVRIKGVATPAELEIVGIPGDHVRNDDTGLYVNDVAVTYFPPDFLDRFRWQGEKVIPDGHYFIMGVARLNEYLTETVGLHPAGDLERVR